MSAEVNFWTAMGPMRKQVLSWLLAASLVYAVLPVLFDEEILMGLYAIVYGLYAAGDVMFAVYQLYSGKVSGVVFIFRLWHAFVVMLLLLLGFGLGGLAMLISR